MEVGISRTKYLRRTVDRELRTVVNCEIAATNPTAWSQAIQPLFRAADQWQFAESTDYVVRLVDIELVGTAGEQGRRQHRRGEAKEADLGIAAGSGKGVIFKRGVPIRNVLEADMVQALWEEVMRFEEDTPPLESYAAKQKQKEAKSAKLTVIS